MALQTSGAISLNDIQTEFGGSNPIAISEYYGAAAGIPSSGTIDLADFYGASAAPPDPVITEGHTQYTTVGKLSFTYEMDGYTINADEVDVGFATTAIGSISPSTYNGVTIEAAVYYNDNQFNQNFVIIMQGNRAKSFFSTVTPQGGNTLTSASSTHSYTSSGNYTKWRWSETVGNTAVLGAGMAAQWNGTGTSTITFT